MRGHNGAVEQDRNRARGFRHVLGLHLHRLRLEPSPEVLFVHIRLTHRLIAGVELGDRVDEGTGQPPGSLVPLTSLRDALSGLIIHEGLGLSMLQMHYPTYLRRFAKLKPSFTPSLA